jgi:hypothetical protein
MNSDEIKGLRLRRTRVKAELDRINNLLNDWDANGTKGWVPQSAKGTNREAFYEQAERDSVNPEDC